MGVVPVLSGAERTRLKHARVLLVGDPGDGGNLCAARSSQCIDTYDQMSGNEGEPYAHGRPEERDTTRFMVKPFVDPHTCMSAGGRYVCPVCHKDFRLRGDFSRHYMIHTGERPFPCPHCPYRANRKTSLVKHMQRNHLVLM